MNAVTTGRMLCPPCRAKGPPLTPRAPLRPSENLTLRSAGVKGQNGSRVRVRATPAAVTEILGGLHLASPHFWHA